MRRLPFRSGYARSRQPSPGPPSGLAPAITPDRALAASLHRRRPQPDAAGAERVAQVGTAPPSPRWRAPHWARQPPAPLRVRPQEAGRPRRAVAAQDVDGFQQGLGYGRRLDVQHAQHARCVAPEVAVAPQDVIQRVRRGRGRERGRPGDQGLRDPPIRVGPRSPRRAPRRCPARRSTPSPARRCPERLANRGRLVPELRFGGARGFAIRSADDPVVGLHHRVGDERLPLDGADRENREAAVVRELAEPVGEVALPLPAQPRDPMRRDVAGFDAAFCWGTRRWWPTLRRRGRRGRTDRGGTARTRRRCWRTWTSRWRS